MPILQIIVNNKPFQIACDDGQEERLQEAVKQLNARIAKLQRLMPKANYELALVMASVLMQDEITDLELKVKAQSEESLALSESSSEMNQTLEAIAEYIEDLAKKID